ncbi:V-type proton ATPase subunit F isoform X1 [Papio anubis]|uniref:V-type proton ATPase subunit F n=1 Tax=Theropithecus gelada TaxID=9565 RepID=A0A8D2K5W7_THEGE|nr:V-type proton ATPase subunit F isoform X1 [Papio anubis]XP_025235155.1 V-type proton ATPase subunit F isoform X2 [Theropithecus gelada]
MEAVLLFMRMSRNAARRTAHARRGVGPTGSRTAEAGLRRLLVLSGDLCPAAGMAGRGKLIAVIGDEDTVTGFLLGGIGELNKNRHPNFLVVEKDTTINEIEDTFRQFLNRDDIGIILINQYIAEMVRHALDAHQHSIPAVLEIPSKEHPYDAAKDSILRRARGMFTAEDLR